MAEPQSWFERVQNAVDTVAGYATDVLAAREPSASYNLDSALVRGAIEQNELAIEQQKVAEAELQDWFDSLYTPATGSRTVVDQAAVAMQTAAINDTLARGLEQLQVQFDLAESAIDTRLTQADEQIEMARAKALESLTTYQRDIEQRGAATSARIGDDALAAAMRNVAASDEALRRAGSMGGLVSAGGMRDIAAAGEQERVLMAGQSEIQQDLNERLTQIASQQSGRQMGLTEQIAQGARSTAEIEAQQLIDDLIAQRSRQEFDLSESNRQRLLELALSPPTKQVGGSKASGILGSQAEVQMVAQLMKEGISRDDALSMVLTGTDKTYFGDMLGVQDYMTKREIDALFAEPPSLTPGQQLGQAQDRMYAQQIVEFYSGDPQGLVNEYNRIMTPNEFGASVSQSEKLAYREALTIAAENGLLSVDEQGNFVVPQGS
ncbi:MAG: hypothetical protein VXA34_01100 [Gammaproteobacteria bacterium]